MARLVAAVLYAACILAPQTAIAVGQAAAHCVGQSEAGHHHAVDGDAHAHAGDADHHHADTAPPTSAPPESDGHAGMCCGVFCLTGLAVSPVVAPAVPGDAGRVAADRDRSMDGRGADRIIRPPKT